ncbi:MAG: imidazoleglycerol-phosphate dehydratase HisB [Pirellulaceae bacterium]|nr:imidazoleglycerol-phosphate dehydratase HisB [Pirellulaceae bacterium]
MGDRIGTIERETAETKIRLRLNIEGSGQFRGQTGIGFLDHMLTLFSKHGLFDLELHAEGDLHIDAHHTTEDIGICLGSAFKVALGEKVGIFRYGYFTLPMDEALLTAAVDFSGRSYFVWNVPFSTEKIGAFDTELVEHFWQSFADKAECNLHFNLHYGRNSHHISEVAFKGAAKAVRIACEKDPRSNRIPSTKGLL